MFAAEYEDKDVPTATPVPDPVKETAEARADADEVDETDALPDAEGASLPEALPTEPVRS